MTNPNTPQAAPLQLSDLVPQNATFFLSEIVDAGNTPIPLTLRRWSLRVRDWAIKKYTVQGIQLIARSMEIGAIADIAFFMLDDESRKHFKDADDFLDRVVTITDQINVAKAWAQSFGIGEVELKKFSDAIEAGKNPPAEVLAGDDPNFAAPSP